MIRPLTADDRAPVADLLQAAGNFTEAELAIADELVSVVLTQPDQKDYYAFVADAVVPTGVVVAGFLLLGPVPATSGSWHMYWLAVHPEWQGRGLAQDIDAWAGRFVREREGYWLLAETSGQPSYERTRAFYLKQGYQLLARIADYYKPHDDLHIFGRRL